MAQTKKENVKKVVVKGGGGTGAVYCLGLIGAAVYYIQQADGFWQFILALLKALVWPAFVVYDLLRLISL